MQPNYIQTASGPGDFGFQITPNDSTDLPVTTRSVRAAGAGVLKWLNMFDGEVQHTTIEAGERVPMRARRILATGTTATGLEGLA